MVDASSVSMASSKLRDLGDKGVLVLEVSHEVRKLAAFHAVLVGVKLVVGTGEGV